MATRWAVSSGNWSAVGTWDGGTTLPGSGDDVYADGKTVTIDQNVTVLSLRTTARSGGTAGGGFTVSGAYTIDCSGGLGFFAGASNCLTCTHTSGTTLTLKGTADQAGTTINAVGIVLSGTGTTAYTGTIKGGGNGAYGISVTGAGTVTLTGNVSPTGTNSPGLWISAAATITLTGTVTAIANQPAMNVGAAANITISGGIVGSASGTGPGINFANVASVVTITGTLTANSGSALSTAGASPTITVTGPFISGGTGILPIYASGPILLSPISNNEFRFKHVTSGTSSLYSSDVTSGAPTAANVRSGVSYGGGTLTGTLKVPNPAYVALGVETDNTVGSLAYNSDSAIADALWNKQTSALTTAGSIGERLKNAATVDTTGAQIAAQAL